ncbi:T9SS type A sorting domain-containing protein [Rudanella paleaurantiibacter]|uniref:T9SS type A sorting domain-containing protein n=1 Tax=Rudanella paleaurantiibacter TaxID=2614655 RepID=A0A7J5U2H5_9BACT|nr:T9SS type A sorting domain-containing protein [Rudanella paleaurantiibacter]KAB7731881.1 T9SS type A sorting domain-containing protein [Rudanella paleaurantiibacter]
MKIRLLYQYSWLTVFVLLISGVRIMAQSITAIGPPNPNPCVAPGGSVSVPFSTTGVFKVSNTFTVQLSDNTGNFPASPVVLATQTNGPSTPTTITMAGVIPANTVAGSYRIRVVSSDPARISSLITINVSPLAPTAGVASPAGQICAGTPVSLTASGTNLKWFNSSGQLVATGSPYTFNATGSGNQTFTVTQLVGLCESPGRAVTITVVAKSPNPTIPAQPSYCQGVAGAPLNATGTNLLWYGTNINNPSPSSSPTVPPTTTAGSVGPFYVSQNTTGCESDRVPITVTINATPSAPAVPSPQAFCQSTAQQTLSPNGTGFRWYTSTGALLPNNGTAPTVSLNTPGTTTYQVSAINNGCESVARSTVQFVVNASPAAIAPVSLAYCEAARPASLTVSGSNVRWYSDAAGNNQIGTPASPQFPNTYTYYVRQFDANNCASAPSAYSVRVFSTPNAPTVTTDLSRCVGDAPRPLSATGTNLTWFDNTGAQLGGAPSPATTAPASLSYSVSQTSNDGCLSPRATAVVIVNAIPAPPTATPPAPLCEGFTPPTLNASGQSLRWYGQSATGGTASGSPSAIDVNRIGLTNYYVSQVVNGCESPRAAIPVTVKDTPDAPGVSNSVFCQNDQPPVLSASTVPNATAFWYPTAQDGTGSSTAPSVPNGTAQTLFYYVSQRLDGCEGPRATLSVRVKPRPGAPFVAPLEFCNNAPSQPIQAQGVNLRYYDPSGNVSGTAPSPPTGTVTTLTYQITQTLEECEGPRATLNVRIKALPSAPGVSDIAYCQVQQDQPAQSVPPVTAQGQNLRWYNTDGNQFPNAPTPQIDQVRTYSFGVSQTVENCEGPRATLNVRIQTTPAPVVSATSVTYCRNDVATPLRATAEQGAQLRWIDPNGNLTNDAPTPFTLNPTPPGGRSFFVYQIGSNGCYSPRSGIRLFVNTNPTLAILGTTSVNLGRTAPLQLRFTGVPPFNYTLSDGTTGTATDTLATVNVMPSQTTVYQVASVSNVCGTGLPGSPATATVTVRIPTITTDQLSTSVLCAGTNLTVPFTTTGEFNTGNVFRVEVSTDSTGRASTTVGVGNASVGPITATIPSSLSGGLYYVRVVASNPGIAVLGRPSPVLLNVRPLPSATLTGTQDIFEGTTARLSISFTGDGPWTFSYADSLRNAEVTTNANPHPLEVRPLSNNTYRLVSVRNNCGPGAVSGTAVVRVLPVLGLEDDPLGSAVKAYPVPTTTTLTIEIDVPLPRQGATVILTDGNGRQVLQQLTRDRQSTLDLSDKPAGVYLLNVRVGDKQTTRRVLKQ